MKNGYWFYIEPYINIFKNNKTVLVYNTLNGSYLEYPNELDFKEIFNKILSPRNNRVISINEKEMNINLIKDLKKIHAGDLLKKEWSKRKPTQISPILNLQNDAERFIKKEANWVGSEMMNNVYELSIYINNYSDNANSQWKYAYKQILSPYSENKNEEIDFLTIQKIVKESFGSSLNVVNIIGGNIFLHTEIKEIINYLSGQNFKVTYHINIADFYENIDKIKLIISRNNYVTLSIFGNKIDIEAIDMVYIDVLKNISIKFILENEEEFQKIERFIEAVGIADYSLHPLYNVDNLNFFKENVFTTQSEIFDNKHSQLEIFQKEKINTNFFGKITILANGDAHANVNIKKLGNIYKQSLQEIIYEEMYRGLSWFKTRKKHKPCNECIYNALCPPISNYEIIMKKYNLCNIKN